MNLFGNPNLPILLVMGVALLLGTLGARVFQRLRVPQTVGYIVIGLLLGQNALGVIGAQTVERLAPVNLFALGVIGFMIGGELHRDIFRRYGRQFFIILLCEGMAAFVLVSALIGGTVYWLTASPQLSVAVGLVLGAISSATAPNGTVDVLWEYKTRGILTTTVFALVALDDCLALLLFAVAASVAVAVMHHAPAQFGGAILMAVYELGGGIVLGVLSGILLNRSLRRLHERGKALAFIIGALALVIGLSRMLGLDIILAAMALGATLTNLAPRRSHLSFELVESFSSPIYALFFVAVGARLDLAETSVWIWLLATAYVTGSIGGKLLGSWLGATWGRAVAPVRKYLGLCLFSQAGIAIGLAISSTERLKDIELAGMPLPAAIIAVIVVTTFILQLIGPPSVKVAMIKAGEVGLNVTEEDLAATYHASDLVEESTVLDERTPLAGVLKTISETDAVAYPVVDAKGMLSGVITINDFRKSLRAQQYGDWLLAYDLMQTAPDPATAQMPLPDAMNLMRDQGVDFLPVVADKQNRRLVGMLQRAWVQRFLAAEVLRRRQQADAGLAAEHETVDAKPPTPAQYANEPGDGRSG